MANTREVTDMKSINDYCQQMTKKLLELAQTFARKSRRPSTKLTCDDLINALEFELIMTTKKCIYYMRHFEALHNIPPCNFRIPDPELSPYGQTQAFAAIETIKNIPSIDLIVCSPLTRTLETSLLVFKNQYPSPFIIHPDLQEVCTEPCDIGSSVDQLKIKFPSLSNELDMFTQTFGDTEWLDKMNPDNIYSPTRIKERVKRLLDWLLNRVEKHIFIISHGLMLKEFLYGGNDQKYNFKNGEIRTVEYAC
ncbi:unnamed protein product [Rotaria socialis]|uniref:Uncharacterized protein n=1 Tax=Rotaria socialis TaxID=392032 RepID=A0A817XV72_9BILA|nr:unnamed protein product [Rotaria socialis]CAF3306535.1 unnamed protein product [Rotaria socialis]CAF3372881.1 unnamed protein product [Rotaria socialis]CAF3632367.1 unnamed protein product [Rotaria socialis]CAF4221990.1 unnamed protein product [Rotaria socialis]